MITIIAAIGQNNELGYQNKIPWHISEDLKHFKSYTLEKVVVMGSNTFASLGHKPLPGRKNIVVTSQELKCASAISAKSISDALSISHCYSEIVIIGGASIYNQTIGLADKLVITHIEQSFEADTYFPHIDLNQWKINSVRESSNENYNYKFVEYLKNEIV